MMNPYKNFHVSQDSRGIRTVAFDVPGRPMNVLTAEVLTELEQIIHDLEDADDVALVLFHSDKESGFLSGADVESLQDFSSGAEAVRAIETGQTLFQRIEWLPMPTVAVIHGPCLGGGLELALACHYRVARDNSSTRIGLPEIKLGLIPAWGGTQRLPKQVGLSNALSMILTGKHLTADQALQMGLVHRSISPDDWQAGLDDFVTDALAGRVIDPHSRRPRWRRMMESTRLGKRMVFRSASQSITRKAKHYPALAAAVKAIQTGFDAGPKGFLCERDQFVDLLATPTCRHLLGLFLAQQKARKLATWTPDLGQVVHQTPIRRIAIVGAGAMGASIGQLAAVRGYDVVLKEVNKQAVQAGERRIVKLVDDYAKRKQWSSDERADLMGRISICCDAQALADSDLVIEAVVEQMEVKESVFNMLDLNTKPTCILTSNTSSLSVTEMAGVTSRGAKVAGLHFFNPVHRMELVEIVRAADTNDETLARLVGFVKALGKTPVVTADAPGFLVNRVLFPYLGEAVRMADEGGDIGEIDKQIRRFGMPMGPFQLLDQVGIDVAYHVARSLASTLPGVEAVANLLSAMVNAGQLGKKTECGFYQYSRGKRRSVAELPLVTNASIPVRVGQFSADSLTAIQRRLVYPMVAEAIRCHEEQIVEHPWAIDLAIVLGTGFAPHLGGPLHLLGTIGSQTVAKNLDVFHGHFGDRFSVPTELKEMAALGGSYFNANERLSTRTVSS